MLRPCNDPLGMPFPSPASLEPSALLLSDPNPNHIPEQNSAYLYTILSIREGRTVKDIFLLLLSFERCTRMH